eukprot:scaffold7745_cov55-Attheya_sp.AAC.6
MSAKDEEDYNNNNDEASSLYHETKEEEDEEGLLVKGYEVVLCGTGLVQSILASALARAGLDILHCDAMPYYGEFDAVLTWDQFASTTNDAATTRTPMTTSSSSTIGSNDEDASVLTLQSPTSMQIHSSSLQPTTTTMEMAEWKVGTELSTPYGPGRLVSLPSSFSPLKDSVVVELTEWKLANQTCPRVYFGANNNNNISSLSELQQYLAQECGVVPMTTLYGEWLYQQRREVGLDVTPGLLFASGPAVDGLLASGVADYLEFKSMLGLYLLSSSSSSSAQELKRVPCSKADVFSTKLLPPADKRKFMKFLQLASDYSVQSLSMTESSSSSSTTTTEMKSSDVEDPNVPQDIVQSVNERAQLKQGRSLSRPQNKAVATGHLTRLVELISLSKEKDSSDGMEENGDDNDDNMTLEAYLREEHKMSDKSENLRHMIVHALALGDATASLSDSMTVLSRHLQSLGRFGGTAFLAPLYGSGELSQAFCRSAAVHGGTYLLRRAPKQILFDSSSSTNGVSGILLGGSERDDNDEFETNVSKDKIIKCQHVVVPAESIPLEEQPEHDVSSSSKLVVLRRISILRGKLIVDETSGDAEQRYIVIIPPNSGNIQNTHVIHGISLDDSVHVVPDLNHYKNMGGCTMLHLTTIIEESLLSDDKTTTNDSSHGDVLERALESILVGQNKQNGSHSSSSNVASSVPLEELHHVSFSYAVPSSSSLLLKNRKGLHICQRPIQSITVDGAFDEARRIFESIVPGAKFLVRSEELDKAVKERIGNNQEYDSDDDEGMVLESAMNMIGSKTATTTTTTSTTTTPISDHDDLESSVELPPKSDQDADS